MRKYNLEIVLFLVNAVYMILELVASRVLAPYFGSSYLVWTSIIGIILLSTSVGNYLGGKIADKTDGDKKKLNKNIEIILIISGILIFLIPNLQRGIITLITNITKDIKIGAIVATLLLFFTPSMFIGMITPIIIKLKINELQNVGKNAGNISALGTLGSIVGTFTGGFVLVPKFGSIQILFILSTIMFLLVFLVEDDVKDKTFGKIVIVSIICIIVNIICFWSYSKINNVNGNKILEGKTDIRTEIDTEYGKVTIYNANKDQDLCRILNIDKGNESATFVNDDKCNELVFEYTKFYDLMFNSSKKIKSTLMIGGAGYSYPKYYISHYKDKMMDVVEIDEKVTEIAKKYFFLDKLIKEYNIEDNHRLQLITDDGRVYLNNNRKKYDAILNDAFSGNSPAKTLTTIEAAEKIYNSLNENGIYLTNIVSSVEGENSKFLQAEVNTLKRVFKNVYVIPCNNREDLYRVQNNMVVATDEIINFEKCVKVSNEKNIILTDNYCPVDTLIPII